MPAASPGRRIAAFLFVGASGFALQMGGVGWLCATGWPLPAATAASVIAAVVHNFLWHERWTWADRGGDVAVRLRRFAGYLATTGATSVLSNVLFVAVLAGSCALPPWVAVSLAVVSTSVVNFLISDRLIFQS